MFTKCLHAEPGLKQFASEDMFLELYSLHAKTDGTDILHIEFHLF